MQPLSAVWLGELMKQGGIDFMGERPEPFKVFRPGVFLHGTKANLAVGETLVPGFESNFESGRISNFVYVTETLDAAAWGAELAQGEGERRIYIVEPEGTLEDDPNLTDKKFPGNPTRSYRTRSPVRVVRELHDWVGHSDLEIETMRNSLASLAQRGAMIIDD